MMSEMPKDPKQETERQFRQLEKRVDAAVEAILRLRREKAALAEKLAESERVRKEAAARIASLLDRLDTPS